MSLGSEGHEDFSWNFSTHLLYLPPVCKWLWAPDLLLGTPSSGFLSIINPELAEKKKRKEKKKKI
jgi:hypothetical protein